MLLLPTLVLALLPGSLAAPSWPSHMTEEVPATWQAEAFPGGPTLNLTGTLQQVRRQLLEINPDYDNAFANVTGDGALTVRGDDFINANTLCSISVYGRCLGRWVADQLYYLRNHAPVRPTLPAGPGKCARVSCEWKSSVWWCNDELEEKTLDSLNQIADGVGRVMAVCQSRSQYGYKRGEVSGQAFSSSNWNVWVGSDCCC